MTESDLITLRLLAEYRILTPSQIAFLELRSRQVVRRRLVGLVDEGCIEAHVLSLGRQRGRPEQYVSLTPVGWSHLRELEMVRPPCPKMDSGAGPHACPRHHLLLNWFRLHLVQIERVLPTLHTVFRDPSSVLTTDRDLEESLVFAGPAKTASGAPRFRFIPDGVIAIHDRESGKALLFFLEVDMGTETLDSGRRGGADIKGKIRRYQRIFTEESYKRYERFWKCRFNGFRLLFLTHDEARLGAMAKLVEQMPPSDFIWLTNADAMFECGIAGSVWVRGGRLDQATRSILGERYCRNAPVVSEIRD